MSNFVIDKGVPLPEYGKGRLPVYPVSEMEVGDSIFTPTENGDATDATIKMRVYSNVQNARRKYPERKFIVRTVEGGIRFWRTA